MGKLTKEEARKYGIAWYGPPSEPTSSKETKPVIVSRPGPIPGQDRKVETDYLGKGDEEETREELEIPPKTDVTGPYYDRYAETGYTGKDRGMPSKVPSFRIPKVEEIPQDQFREETVVPWQELEQTYYTKIEDVKRAAYEEGIEWYEVTTESGEKVRWDWRAVVQEYEKQLGFVQEQSTESQLGIPSKDTKIIKRSIDEGYPHGKVEYGFIPRDPSLDWSRERIEDIESIPPPLFTFKGFTMMGLATLHTFAGVIKIPFEWATGKKYPHYVTSMDIAFEPMGLSPEGSADLAKRMGVWGAAGTVAGEYLLFKGFSAGIKGATHAVGSVSKWYIRNIASAYEKFTKFVPEEKLVMKTISSTKKGILEGVYKLPQEFKKKVWGMYAHVETEEIPWMIKTNYPDPFVARVTRTLPLSEKYIAVDKWLPRTKMGANIRSFLLKRKYIIDPEFMRRIPTFGEIAKHELLHYTYPRMPEMAVRHFSSKTVGFGIPFHKPTVWSSIYKFAEKIHYTPEFPGRGMVGWAKGKLVFMKEYPLVAGPQIKTVSGIRFEIAKYSGFGKYKLVPSNVAEQIKSKVLGEGAGWLRGTPSKFSPRFEATKIGEMIKVQGRFKKTILDIKGSLRQRFWEVGDTIPYDFVYTPKATLKFGQMYYFTPTTTIQKTGRPIITGGIKHFGELGGKTITVPITTSLTVPATALGYGMVRLGATGIISERKTDVLRTPMDITISAQLPALTSIQVQDAIQMQKQMQKQATALQLQTIVVPASQQTRGGTGFTPHAIPAPVKVRFPFIIPLGDKDEKKKRKKFKPIDWGKGYRERTWKVLSMEDLLKGSV